MTIYDIYGNIAQATVLLPVAAALFHYKRLSSSFRILFWFFFASIFFEILSIVLVDLYNNNMPGLHVFTLLEFEVFSMVFYYYFRDSKILRNIILMNMLLFVFIALLDAFKLHTIWQFNTLSRPYAAFSLILYSLLFFYKMMNYDVEHYAWQYPMFWVGLGVLVYFGSNIFFFMMGNYLIGQNKHINFVISKTLSTLNIIANIIFALSFLCFRIKKT